MIRHIVFYKMHHGFQCRTDEENFQMAKELLEGMKAYLPGIRTLEVTRTTGKGDYDLCIYSEMDSMEVLESYSTHPHKDEIRLFVKQLCYDKAEANCILPQ